MPDDYFSVTPKTDVQITALPFYIKEVGKTQLDWLKRIEKVLLEESVLDEQIFEVGAFKNAGGFTIIDRRFGGKLREIMTELNEYLYDDGGSVA